MLSSSATLQDLIDRHAGPIVSRLRQPQPGHRLRDIWPAPEDAAECGALLLASRTLLGDRERTELRDRVQPLLSVALSRKPAGASRLFRQMTLSPDLTYAFAGKRGVIYRAGGHRNTNFRKPSCHCTFKAVHVPALLPEQWLSDCFGDLMDAVGGVGSWIPRHVRRAASLKLIEMCSGGTWSEAAQFLGMPWNTAEHSLKVLERAFAPQSLWPTFESSVEQVARLLDAEQPSPDYALRRSSLHSWRLPEDDWSDLLTGLPSLARHAAPVNRLAGTVFVWTRATQGDHVHSPALMELRRSGQSTSPLMTAHNQLTTPASRRGARLELLARMSRYADELAAACDRTSGSGTPGGATAPPPGSGVTSARPACPRSCGGVRHAQPRHLMLALPGSRHAHRHLSTVPAANPVGLASLFHRRSVCRLPHL